MRTSLKTEKIGYDHSSGSSKKGRKLSFETRINCSADSIWELYQSPSAWIDHLNPQAKLIPISSSVGVKNWTVGQKYPFHLLMYGFIPFGKHHVSFEYVNPERLTIQSREHGFMVPHWDNYFELAPESDSCCTIKDVLTIQSTGINAIVAWYAIGVFKAKHKKLARRYN